MASLGRFEFTVLSATGAPVSGATVGIRKQGAQIVGSQSGSPLTVDHVGMITAGDVIVLNDGSTTRNVSAVTATTVTCGAGFTVVDDDRLSIAISLPTIYEDNQGNTTASNPMTTDANGFVSCYLTSGYYDVKLSGSGITTRLIQDVPVVGGETSQSTVYDSGSAVAFVLDTYRALTTTAKLLSVRNNTSEKFSVDQAGNVAAAGTLAVTGASTLTGAVSAVAALTVGTTLGVTGVSTTTGIVNTGTISTTTDLTTRRMFAKNGTALVNGDFALSGGWGAGATVAVSGTCTDQRGAVLITAGPGPGALPDCTLTFKNGTYGAGSYYTMLTRNDAQAPLAAYWKGTLGGTTTMIVTFSDTPVNGSIYSFSWFNIG